MLSIAACLSHKPPFSGGSLQDGADAARAALAAPGSGTLASGQQSDHLVMAAAVDGWLAALKKDGKKGAGTFARKHFLSEQTLDMLRDMRAQFATMLADIGFARGSRSGRNVGDGQATGQRHWYDDRSEPFNKHASHPAVVKAVLLAALFPNLAVMDDSSTAAGQRPGWHDGFGAVAIHPSSICAHMPGAAFQRPFLTYLEKMRTSQVFLRDCTVVSPAAVLLFGSELQVDHAAGKATVGGWVQLRVPGTTAALVRRLRVAMQELLAGKVAALRRRQGEEGEGGGEVVEAIVQLLNHEEAAQGWGK